MSSYITKGWVSQFFQSPNCIFDVEELSTIEKMCYLYLCRCADGDLQSFPSYTTIGEKTSSSRRTATRAIKSLEEKGYLNVERRKKSNTENMTNVYTIIHPHDVKKCVIIPTPSVTMTPPSDNMTLPPSAIMTPPSVTVTPNKYSLKNTNFIINTQQQQEPEKSVVVALRERYESLFKKKLSNNQAEELITLGDKHDVDVLHKVENTYEIHLIQPRKSIVASIKHAIVNGDWEILSPTQSTNKPSVPMPKAIARQREGVIVSSGLTREELDAKKAEIRRKIDMLEKGWMDDEFDILSGDF